MSFLITTKSQYRRSKLNCLLIIILIFIVAMMPTAAYADCAGSIRYDEPKLRFVIGGQFTHLSPEIFYKEKKASNPREVTVKKNFTEDRYVAFPSMKLEYQTSPVSSWSGYYNRDETHSSAQTQEKIKFLFFPITLTLRIPVEIDMQSLKIFYNRALLQRQNFEVGGSLGMHALWFDAKAEQPIWGNERYNYLVPLPALGIFASYKQSEYLKYSLRTNFFSLGSLSVGSVTAGGSVVEADFSVEYQLSRNLLIGGGYRYAYLQVALDQEKYKLDGSHITYGPTVYAGASF